MSLERWKRENPKQRAEIERLAWEAAQRTLRRVKRRRYIEGDK